jgi:undecaprenyl diphosphate synthase
MSTQTPQHVGIILDGNRRWAKERGLPDGDGHVQGVETLKEVVKSAFGSGVKIISAYVFSTENWKRTKSEVKFLMSLLLRVLDKDLAQLHKEGVKVVVLGSRYGLSKKIVSAIERAEEKTKNNEKGVLALCLNYGGHQELVDAVKKILQARVEFDEVTAEVIAKNLYHPEVPPIDLIIRTSGEHRLSNFMLWRSEYAELYFSDKYWPDFTDKDLQAALEVYANRERRIGQ